MTDASYRPVDLSIFDGNTPLPGLRDPKPTALEWVKIRDLVIDEAYQRPIEKRGRQNISNIATGFDWARFTPLLIAPVEPEGRARYAIIDGQHRAHAAALRGLAEVPAFIVEMSHEEQAKAFAWVNGHVTNITGFQIFKASLAAGEFWAVDSGAAVEAAGCRLMVSNKSTSEKRPGEIFCIELVRRYIAVGKADVIVSGLTAVRGCPDGNLALMYSATVLRPWFAVIDDFGLAQAAPILAGFLAENRFEVLLRKVDRLRETPEYFNKSRAFLLHACLKALMKQRMRDLTGGNCHA